MMQRKNVTSLTLPPRKPFSYNAVFTIFNELVVFSETLTSCQLGSVILFMLGSTFVQMWSLKEKLTV